VELTALNLTKILPDQLVIPMTIHSTHGFPDSEIMAVVIPMTILSTHGFLGLSPAMALVIPRTILSAQGVRLSLSEVTPVTILPTHGFLGLSVIPLRVPVTLLLVHGFLTRILDHKRDGSM
jgi:hypothetical protein